MVEASLFNNSVGIHKNVFCLYSENNDFVTHILLQCKDYQICRKLCQQVTRLINENYDDNYEKYYFEVSIWTRVSCIQFILNIILKCHCHITNSL